MTLQEPYKPILRYYPDSPVLNRVLMKLATIGDCLMQRLFVDPLLAVCPAWSPAITKLRMGRWMLCPLLLSFVLLVR